MLGGGGQLQAQDKRTPPRHNTHTTSGPKAEDIIHITAAQRTPEPRHTLPTKVRFLPPRCRASSVERALFCDHQPPVDDFLDYRAKARRDTATTNIPNSTYRKSDTFAKTLVFRAFSGVGACAMTTYLVSAKLHYLPYMRHRVAPND